jgi:hypothetical protein
MSKNRSAAYVATVFSLNHDLIATTKHRARILNALRRVEELKGTVEIKEWLGYDGVTQQCFTRYRTLVRPRLGKNNKHSHLYAVGGPLKRSSAQVIKPEHGSRVDVYLTGSLVERKKV